MMMRLICLLAVAAVAANAQYTVRPRPSRVNTRQRHKPTYEPKDTEILLAYVMFRHGDRSPGPEEIETLPILNLNSSVFFPYGYKGLTNVGKQHAYNVGEYLRKRYNGFLSDYYLPEEISVRTTDFSRTKMTVLTALAALYPPNRAQKWHSYLNWQPVPYDTLDVKEDDLSVYKSCPRYAGLKNKVYEIPEIRDKLKENEEFFEYLSEKTGHKFKTPTDMYFMNNLVHSLDNVGVKFPQWLEEARPKIAELTSLEFECEFYTDQLKSLGGGVVLGEFVSSSNSIISGDKSGPKVHLLSAHETSVAAFMAAATVFNKPHQPKYGATFSLELYRNTTSNHYAVMAVYAPEPGGPGTPIPIPNCGGKDLCDFDTFLDLTKNIYVTRNEHQAQCSSTVKN